MYGRALTGLQYEASLETGEQREVKECSKRVEGIVDSSSEEMEWGRWMTIGGGERERHCPKTVRRA